MPCTWGVVLSNDPLDVFCLARLPPSLVLLTHAAFLGSALTSVRWDTATWQWGVARGSVQERHWVKYNNGCISQPVLYPREIGKRFKQASQSVRPHNLPQEVDFLRKENVVL